MIVFALLQIGLGVGVLAVLLIAVVEKSVSRQWPSALIPRRWLLTTGLVMAVLIALVRALTLLGQPYASGAGAMDLGSAAFLGGVTALGALPVLLLWVVFAFRNKERGE